MNNSDKIILDLCGGTGAWSKPYKDNGYNVRVITLPEHDLLDEKVVEFCVSLKAYGILFAAECTVWTNSGNRWWKDRTPDEIYYFSRLLVKGLRVIYNSNPNFYAIENPVGKMSGFLGKPNFIFNPCDFGDAYLKRTCLWGKFNIPEKSPIEPIIKYYRGKKYSYIGTKYGGKSEYVIRMRSITPTGFANAFYEANK